MLQVKVLRTTPPCANGKRAEAQALQAAGRFPGQAEVVHLDAMGPEVEQFGLMTPPVLVLSTSRDQSQGASYSPTCPP